jgi:uncharacterized cupin superfamily protein
MPAEAVTAGFTISAIEGVPDAFGGEYPGAMRFLTGPLDTEQISITYREMPPGSGGKGSYGHYHRTQEEIYVVLAGRLAFKFGDEIHEAGPLAAVRVAPDTVRSVHNEGPDHATLLIVSTRSNDPRDDVELVEGFWPAT